MLLPSAAFTFLIFLIFISHIYIHKSNDRKNGMRQVESILFSFIFLTANSLLSFWHFLWEAFFCSLFLFLQCFCFPKENRSQKVVRMLSRFTIGYTAELAGNAWKSLNHWYSHQHFYINTNINRDIIEIRREIWEKCW